MRNFHTYHLPKVIKDPQPEAGLQVPNQLEAQDSLFEISKTDQHLHSDNNFIKELLKKRADKKRYPHTSMSLPKKKDIEQLTLLPEFRSFRQTMFGKNINGTPISITNFFVIDERRHQKRHRRDVPPKDQRSSIQQQVNRKAKYLFRMRNRMKNSSSSFDSRHYEPFQDSFYLGKIELCQKEQK